MPISTVSGCVICSSDYGEPSGEINQLIASMKENGYRTQWRITETAKCKENEAFQMNEYKKDLREYPEAAYMFTSKEGYTCGIQRDPMQFLRAYVWNINPQHLAFSVDQNQLSRLIQIGANIYHTSDDRGFFFDYSDTIYDYYVPNTKCTKPWQIYMTFNDVKRNIETFSKKISEMQQSKPSIEIVEKQQSESKILFQNTSVPQTIN